MPTPDAPRLHRAARIEDAAQEFFLRKLGRRPRRPAIVPYAGYGAPGWARVMGRVLLTRADRDADRRPQKLRGWRSFATLPAKGVPVTVEAGDVRTEVHADRSGLIDTVVKADLTPGWCRIRLSTPDADTVEAPIRVIDPAARFGIISDIDDTVMVTALPRPLLAGWNTFVLDEHARAAVPGMAVLYERITNARPGSPVLYLSTGAWNVAPALTRFLSRNLYPAGPLLLTDWGPTQDRWFRSGTRAQAGDPGAAGGGVPRHALAAGRRRRPARPGDLPRVPAPAPGERRRRGDPAALADPGGPRRKLAARRRREAVGVGGEPVDLRPGWRTALEAAPRGVHRLRELLPLTCSRRPV